MDPSDEKNCCFCGKLYNEITAKLWVKIETPMAACDDCVIDKMDEAGKGILRRVLASTWKPKA